MAQLPVCDWRRIGFVIYLSIYRTTSTSIDTLIYRLHYVSIDPAIKISIALTIYRSDSLSICAPPDAGLPRAVEELAGAAARARHWNGLDVSATSGIRCPKGCDVSSVQCFLSSVSPVQRVAGAGGKGAAGCE